LWLYIFKKTDPKFSEQTACTQAAPAARGRWKASLPCKSIPAFFTASAKPFFHILLICNNFIYL
jgi:hypothetical protein